MVLNFLIRMFVNRDNVLIALNTLYLLSQTLVWVALALQSILLNSDCARSVFLESSIAVTQSLPTYSATWPIQQGTGHTDPYTTVQYYVPETQKHFCKFMFHPIHAKETMHVTEWLKKVLATHVQFIMHSSHFNNWFASCGIWFSFAMNSTETFSLHDQY
jgi:hypothetical protein